MRRCLPALALAAAACAVLAAQPTSRLVIVNARLLDVQAGRVRAIAALVVEGTTIAAVHATEPAQGLEGTKLDAGGALIVPALTDLSLQTLPGMDLDADYYYLLSLAHGVMRARTVDVHLPWSVQQRGRIEVGDVLAPRVRTSGPAVDMRTPLGAKNQALLAGGLQPLVRVADGPALSAEIRRQATAGVDWIRLEGNVPLDVVRTAVAATRTSKVRLSLAPFATSMTQAAAAGVPLLDGLGLPLRSLVELDASAKSRPRPGTPPATAAETAWAQLTDSERRTLVAALRRAGTIVAPMLTVADADHGSLPDVDRDLALLPERLRPSIQGRMTTAAGSNSPNWSNAKASRQKFLRDYVAAGGQVVTASGSRADGFPVPGVSIHRELAGLVEAGLTPLDAIRASTTWADAALGSPSTPRFRAGAPADFFGVKGDPSTNIGDMTNISLIVRAGEVLDREQLLRQARRATGRVK
jgi:hypothetical protein